MEQLIKLTNSKDFFMDWSFFLTGFDLKPRTARMIVSLEAEYEHYFEDSPLEKRSWNIACKGFVKERLRAGYLIPFYGIKVLQDHPILLNYESKTSFSITDSGSCKNLSSLMGELLVIHKEKCGNWVQFDRLFGFLPNLLKTNTEFTLEAPTTLLDYYLSVFQRHELNYKIKDLQPKLGHYSVLLFSSAHHSDNYDYGQPYVVATSFELLEDPKI
jgi:hypothetical protein